MSRFIKFLINGVSVFIVAYILPGVVVENIWVALLFALVLGILNVFIRPIILFLALPATILTLGLFTLVVNAVLVLLAGKLVSGFYVDGFWWAFLFSLVLGVVNSVLDKLVED